MKKLSRLFVAATVFAGIAAAAVADELQIRENHPDVYIVKKGDTLWDIAGYFLEKPWRWPEIWQNNPQIANPDLIYPGDRLTLVYIDGQPRLIRQQNGVVKLSPTIRSTPWAGAIPAIPYDAIAPFLSRPYVMAANQLDSAPYVVAITGEHIAGGEGGGVYVRSIDSDEHHRFDIIRPGGPYLDAQTGEVLGYEALFIGVSELQRTGDPATLLIESSQLEVLPGDRLIPATEARAVGDFYPMPPKTEVTGAIIDVPNGVNAVGPLDVVVIDRGASDGLEPGSVLRVDRRGERIFDKIAGVKGGKRQYVNLPDEPAGHLIVFRTFDRVSFGLIVDATLAVHVGDIVTNP